MIKYLEGKIPEEEIEVYNELKKVLINFGNMLYPGNEIYNILIKLSSAKYNNTRMWKKLFLGIISMLKLHENILKVSLPMLYDISKGIIRDIYCMIALHIGYPQRIIRYLTKETENMNNKVMLEYKRMGEVLLFEQYFTIYLSKHIPYLICECCLRPILYTNMKVQTIFNW